MKRMRVAMKRVSPTGADCPGGGVDRDDDAADPAPFFPRPNERRPPPVQACADWQVLLHLPQTEAWLRASGARVTRLTSSVAQDGDNRHVDTHLLQLKVNDSTTAHWHIEPIRNG